MLLIRSILFEVDPERLEDDFIRVSAAVNGIIAVVSKFRLKVNDYKTNVILFTQSVQS